MLLLQCYNLAKIVKTQNCRFSTMPMKVDYRIGIGIDVLDNIFFQDVVGHAEYLALWIEVFFLQIITIVTIQVADRAGRFGKNLKITRSLRHPLFPNQ